MCIRWSSPDAARQELSPQVDAEADGRSSCLPLNQTLNIFQSAKYIYFYKNTNMQWIYYYYFQIH